MAEERTRRRLAAIMAADVVGYSRLMEEDEAGTLAILKARRRDVLEPLMGRHLGRVFKVTGDGVLIEFESAVDAVQCAVDLQREMAAANEGVPAGKAIVLRIGLNLGDIIIDGGDRYGEGINIAARLEEIAEPGGILVSGAIYDQARNKVAVSFQELGPQALKNMAQPVRAYRIGGSRQQWAAAGDISTKKPAIAVLPFVHMGGGPDEQYFGDGITEDIITELSRFHSLFVIARNSSFQFRGAAADVKRIAGELGVQYVVEGSVRRTAARIRITAQLIEAPTGNHLWAEHYDRDAHDIFMVQDEVAQAIAATIEGRMISNLARRSSRKRMNDLAAYDCFLQGRECIEQRGEQHEAARLLQRAIELDPSFAQAHAWLARVHIFFFHMELRVEALQQALALARTALSIEETDAWSHAIFGNAAMFLGQHGLAQLHLERAVALNPNDVRITSKQALLLAYTGKGEEAVERFKADLRRDPFPPAWFWDYWGIALFQARRYAEAVQALGHLIRLYPWDYYYLIASYAHLGLIAQAKTAAAELLQARPTFAVEQVSIIEPFQHASDLDHLLDGLRKAGLP